MGRLPLQFAGKTITWRLPYNIEAELDVGPNQSGIVFPEAAFLFNVDKPFEIHRVMIRLAAKGTPPDFDNPTVLEPQPTTLDERIRLRILDFAKNENLTKSATLVSTLLNKQTGAWDFEEPYTIVRSEGFQVQIDTQDYPSIVFYNANIEPVQVDVQFVRVALNWQGYLTIIGPPSEVR